jgi:hypothetical protein
MNGDLRCGLQAGLEKPVDLGMIFGYGQQNFSCTVIQPKQGIRNNLEEEMSRSSTVDPSLT